MIRRRRAVVAVVVAVAAIVVIGGGFAVSRLVHAELDRLSARRASSRRRPASGVDHTYTGDFPYSVGGGVAVLDCDGDGRPDLYVAGGSGPAALYRNESTVGGALRFATVADPATDLTAVIGAYPLDIDGDGTVDLAVLRNGENVAPPRARRLPVRARQRGVGVRRRRRDHDRVQRDLGGLGQRCRRWRSATTSPTPDTQDPDHLCADNELVRPAAGGRRYAAPIPLTPSWCALSMLFSDWDRSGRRDLRVSNDRHYYSDLSDGQEQLWRIAAGRGAAPVHGRRRLGDGAGSRAWASPATTSTGDGYPEVVPDEPGPERPPDAARRAVAADLPRHGAQARRHRDPAVDRRRPAAVDRLAPGVRGRQQRRLHRPVRLEGQRRPAAGLREHGPARPVPRPARRHVRPGRRGGRHRRLRRAGAARRSPTSTSTACSTSSRSIYDAPVRLWRNIGVAATAAAPAPIGPLARRPADPARARTAMRSAPGSRSRSATRRSGAS